MRSVMKLVRLGQLVVMVVVFACGMAGWSAEAEEGAEADAPESKLTWWASALNLYGWNSPLLAAIQ
jgi:hypothetical protein